MGGVEGPIVNAIVRAGTRAGADAVAETAGQVLERAAVAQAGTEAERLAAQQAAARGAAATDTLGAPVANVPARLGTGGAADALPAPGAQVAPRSWPEDALFTPREIATELAEASNQPGLARGIRDEAGLRGLFRDNQAWNQFVTAVGSNEDPTSVRSFIGNMMRRRTPEGMVPVTSIGVEDVARAVGSQQAVGVANEASRIATALPRSVGTSGEVTAFAKQLRHAGTTLEEATQAREIARTVEPLVDQYPDAARAVLAAATDALEAGHGLDTVLARAQTLAERLNTPGRMGSLNNATPQVQRDLTRQYLRADGGSEDTLLGVTMRAPQGSYAAQQAEQRAARQAAEAAGTVLNTAGVPRAVREATGAEIPGELNGVLPQQAQQRLAGMSEERRAMIGRNNGWAQIYAAAQHDPAFGAQLVYELNRHGVADVPTTMRIAGLISEHPGLERVGAGYWAQHAIPELVGQQIRSGTPAQQVLGELSPIVRQMSREQRTELYRGLMSPDNPAGLNLTDYRAAINGWWPSVR